MLCPRAAPPRATPDVPDLRLSLLWSRRALHPLVVLGAALLVWLALRGEPSAALRVETGGRPTLADPLRRHDAWLGLAVWLAPALVAVAASTRRRWLRGERDWLAPRARSRGVLLLSTWLGLALGAAALVGLGALAIEAPLEGGAAERAVARLEANELARDAERGGLRWRCADPGRLAPPGSRVRVDVGLLWAGATSATLELTVRRGDAERTTRAEVRGRERLAVELPPGPGALACSLRRVEGEAAPLLQRPGCELLAPAASARLAGLELALRLWLACAAWCALVVGAAAWVSGASAALLAALAWVPAWAVGGGWTRALPGADLGAALELASQGLVPPATTPAVWATAAACVAASLLAGACAPRAPGVGE